MRHRDVRSNQPKTRSIGSSMEGDRRMTKRDFEFIADVLSSVNPLDMFDESIDENENAKIILAAYWSHVCERFSEELKSTNERFQQDKFREACGL